MKFVYICDSDMKFFENEVVKRISDNKYKRIQVKWEYDEKGYVLYVICIKGKVMHYASSYVDNNKFTDLEHINNISNTLLRRLEKEGLHLGI